MNKKTFKFEFIQRNIKYMFSFSACVNEKLAEELNAKLIDKLLKCKYECEAYLMVVDWFISENKSIYQIDDFKTSADILLMNNTDINWNSEEKNFVLHETVEKPHVYDITQLNQYIGDFDYYFAIKSIGYWYNCPYDCARNSYLVITKRVKNQNTYSFKTIVQFAELDFEENDFYSVFSFYKFSVSTKNDNLLLDFYLNKKNLLEHFDKDLEETEIVIPVEFPRIHQIQTFSDYLPFLQNIDSIVSLEDIEKLRTTSKQKIMFPQDLR